MESIVLRKRKKMRKKYKYYKHEFLQCQEKVMDSIDNDKTETFYTVDVYQEDVPEYDFRECMLYIAKKNGFEVLR